MGCALALLQDKSAENISPVEKWRFFIGINLYFENITAEF